MRTISLRQFRDSIAALDESVYVIFQDRENHQMRVLGTWSPARQPGSPAFHGGLQAVADNFGHSRPAPKPGRK